MGKGTFFLVLPPLEPLRACSLLFKRRLHCAKGSEKLDRKMDTVTSTKQNDRAAKGRPWDFKSNTPSGKEGPSSHFQNIPS